MIIALQTLIYFRESLFTILNRMLGPYYKRLALVKASSSKDDEESDEEEDVHVYSDYDEEKGVVFFPPMYAQRYAAVSDCLLDERWCGNIEKVVDLGYNDISFIKYLKEVPGVRHILGVDLESIPLRCSSGLFGCEEYTPKRENPLTVTLFQGNAADPDFRLIGCDAVVAIEIIEHMLPHDLERLVHTVFGFIKPWVAIFTTPNGDFNVLFKSLERNGLRRLDHLFEWSREQFNDWCSNIVVRYPNYTVSCKGIGPGPAGTIHLGCCSQMAVFTALDYQKQRDLDPQSMAMIATAPKIDSLVLTSNWETESSVSESRMICNNEASESVPEMLSEKSSFVQLSTPSIYEIGNLECCDSTAQCNLDKEVAINFLMFDQDMETYQKETYNVLVPRRRVLNRVYYIGDVASRLNCTTLQVKKFSKATQNLMAMNKIDSLAHTREVVNEIKQLTSMLNFEKPAIKCKEELESNIWCNINWGDNAPYWNQYYKVVRDYSYPFETKSEECRIIDLISDEINRLIDTQYDNDYGMDINKLEIPLAHLMQKVQHITDDQDRVKDILEWNGYEIAGDVVVHSRMVLDNLSSGSVEDEWQENETSDGDTELKTTSVSDGTSTLHELPALCHLPSFLGRCLRRALDNKVRKLRSMMTADEDITSELDKVVCRLMKLTLRTSKGRQKPPPTKWMQCKLLDLLTLTEKAVERRRKHIIENFMVRAIAYGDEDSLSVLNKIKEDNAGFDIVKKYSHLVRQTPDLTEGRYFPMEIDEITVNSNDEFAVVDHSKMTQPTKTSLERTQAWVQEELELVKYPKHNRDGRAVCSTDSGSYDYQKSKRRKMTNSIKNILPPFEKKNSQRHKNKPDDNIKCNKKVICNKSSSYLRCNIKKYMRKREIKDHKILQSSVSKPIPGSLIELCIPDSHGNKILEKSTDLCSDILNKQDEIVVAQMAENKINNEESYLGDIVMDGDGETSLLHGVAHHTTGTDVETDKKQSEKDTVLGSVINAYNGLNQDASSAKSQTMFLYDINEPSTSKGVRHVSMDVQCGPDDDLECLVPTSSPLDLNDSKSKHSMTNMFVDSKKSDFGPDMCGGSERSNSMILPRTKSVGIKIKDSDTQIHEAKEKEPKISSGLTQVSKEDTDITVIKIKQSKDSPLNLNLVVESEIKSRNTLEKADMAISKTLSENTSLDIANILVSRIKLCYAGLHVHNYKEDQNLCEDVDGQNERQKKTKSDSVKKSANESNKSSSIKVPLKNISNIHEKKVTHRVDSCTKAPKRSLQKNALSRKVESSPIDVSLVTGDITEMGHNTMTQGITKTIRNPKLTVIKKRSITRLNENETNTGAKTAFQYRGISSTSNLKKISSRKGSVLLKNSPVTAVNTLSNSKHDSQSHIKKGPKCYIPSYLRRKNNLVNKTEKQSLNESIDTVKSKLESNSCIPRLQRAKTDDIKSLTSLPPKHLSEFLVYRNETRKSKDEDVGERSVSPVSVASSTCSSPTSVITIKMRPCSNPCNKNSDTGSKSATSIKSKKTTKSRKLSSKEDKDDKENDPGILCSENAYIATYNPAVFMTQLSNTPLHSTDNTLIRQRKSVIPDVENVVEKRSSVEIEKKSQKSIGEEMGELKSMEIEEQSTMMVKRDADLNNDWDDFHSDYPRTSTPIREIESKEVDNRLLSDLLELTEEPSNENLNPVFMTEMIDEMLKVINTTSGSPRDLDSRTVTLSQEDLRDDNFDDETISVESPRTVVETLQNIMECDEQEGDNSFDTVVPNEISGDSTFTEIEMISFQTCTATTNNATNALQHVEDGNESHPLDSESANESYHTATRDSVLDIFERKETLSRPDNIGPLAIQAFSGFSVNNPPAIGDQQTDYINLFDSETGSPAMGVSRQAESEEMFVSGRSSITYVSCSIDEDGAVPDWLFRIINQPLQVQDEDLEEIVVPLPEPHYDANGNVVDTLIGTAAGAGDGRGIHSDVSQDSSGQGSSLSSSDPSSGPQSEAVLIDPSILTGQFGIPPPIPLQFDSAVSSPLNIAAGETVEAPTRISRDFQHEAGPLLGASDADADESSLDTDAD